MKRSVEMPAPRETGRRISFYVQLAAALGVTVLPPLSVAITVVPYQLVAGGPFLYWLAGAAGWLFVVGWLARLWFQAVEERPTRITVIPRHQEPVAD